VDPLQESFFVKGYMYIRKQKILMKVKVILNTCRAHHWYDYEGSKPGTQCGA